MRVLRMSVASYANLKARTLAIARGEHVPSDDEPKLWVTSLDSVAKLLSGGNQELLRSSRNSGRSRSPNWRD